MSNAFQDPERPVICPYDKNHTVFASRYNTHIVKCRKNHPDSGIAVCDYNHDHRIPKLELKYHHEVCPDRIAQEARPKDLVDDENVMEFPIKNLAAPVDFVWLEEDLNHQGYDAEDYSAQNNVLRLVSVEKPSVKKQFRKDEQKRMNSIRAPTASSSTTTSSNEVYSSKKTNVIEEKPIDEDKPELSLADRLQKGLKVVYEPADPEEFKFPKKTSRKNRK